jgi:hypothetical protein
MTQTQTPTKLSAPRTELADLMALFGRFFSSVLLMMLTIVMLLRHSYAVAAVTALAALLTQRATIKLYRRLRDERMAALEAVQTQTEEQPHAA